MVCQSQAASNVRSVLVSFPGGPARQFRVQCFENEVKAWHCHASFHRPDLAEACAKNLAAEGRQVRLVAIRTMPTAM